VTPAPARSLGRGARARILEAARRRFGEQGINATGISELVAAARVSRRTLYQQFAGKDELVAAYLRDLASDPDALPQRVLDREDLTARARLLELFTALADGPRPWRGDPFLAAAVELADPAHPARRLITRRQRELVERLGTLAREAGAKDAERVGARLVVLYAGAAAMVVATDDPWPVAEATALARALLADAIDD
jgi:AcrR family transcriptional regulator